MSFLSSLLCQFQASYLSELQACEDLESPEASIFNVCGGTGCWDSSFHPSSCRGDTPFSAVELGWQIPEYFLLLDLSLSY